MNFSLKRRLHPFVGLLLGIAIILAALLTGVSSPQPAVERVKTDINIPQIKANASVGNLTNPKEIEAFLDEFFAENMPQMHVPGAAFILVKDGKTIVSKGYGYADLERQIPVDPEKTVFGVASISKAITATAVMQLVEVGKLELHQDINNYLDGFQIDDTFDAPITLAHLLTHTDGFDDRFIGAAARHASDVMPLKDYVATRMPARIRPPDEVISYANYGTVLAGYIVQEVSGMPFAQYVDEKILQPLGMTHSSFLQVPDSASDSDLEQAVGYQHLDISAPQLSFQFRGVRNPPLADSTEIYQALPAYYANNVPAGVFQGTAADIARFMMAHLQNGRLGDRQILQTATAQMMHQQQFTHDPHLPGWCYGFNERFQNGIRVIEKAGSKPGFNSLMVLLPDRDLGFFITYNRGSKKLREALVNEFFDRYFPVQNSPSNPQPDVDSAHQMSDFVGHYRYVRYPHRTLEKLGPVLLGFPQSAAELHVTLDANQHLVLENSELIHREPLIFQTHDGIDIVFRENEHQQITHLLIGSEAFEKLAWYQTNLFQTSVFGACVLMFLSVALTEMIQVFSTQLSSSSPSMPRSFLRLEALAHLTVELNLLFLIGVVAVLTLGNLYEFAYRVPPLLVTLLVIPVVTAGITGILVVSTAVLLCQRDGFVIKHGLVSRQIRYFGTLVALIAFLSCLNYWNFLGFNF
ncbi:MAG: serine hydrolase domain-containing protein [Elainellaceae cyanobacterium]